MQDLEVIKLENEAIKASFIPLGTSIVSLEVPDRHGTMRDVVLGYKDRDLYRRNPLYLGCVVGRNANRIAGGKFRLHDVQHQMPLNEGANNLHSGPDGWNLRAWEHRLNPDPVNPSVRFSLHSPDGDQGLPGEVSMSVTYTLRGPNQLVIDYAAAVGRDTLLNPTQHTYFNLHGENAGSAETMHLQINSPAYTPTDHSLIPTGEIRPVAGTPMDFRTSKPINQDLYADYPDLILAQGFDHNFVLENQGTLEPAATLYSPRTGITMNILTDRPGIQFYGGQMLDGSYVGKCGKPYQKFAGICLETQKWPDAIHHPSFPSPVVKAGKFNTQTILEFNVISD